MPLCRFNKRAAGLLLLFAAVFAAAAQETGEPQPLRPVNSTYTLEAGSSHIADTYLSPLKYQGWHAAFSYRRLQAMKFSPERWRQALAFSVEGNVAENPARNASMQYFALHFGWGMLRRFDLPYGISVMAGGEVAVDGGAVINRRNGNNPVSAKGSATVGLLAETIWKTRIGRMPVMARWMTRLPLTGAFFSPEYDELYYEIYLGNHRGLVHAAWPGNLFMWDNELTADLDFASNRLRVGVGSQILSSKVNGLTTRIFSWSFILGVTTDWLSLRPSREPQPENTRIIYAY